MTEIAFTIFGLAGLLFSAAELGNKRSKKRTK